MKLLLKGCIALTALSLILAIFTSSDLVLQIALFIASTSNMIVALVLE